MAKIDYFLTIRDGNKAQDELTSLCQKLENRESKLSITKFAVAKRKIYEAKLIEESIQEYRNKVLIKKFIPEWNLYFLDVPEKNVCVIYSSEVSL